LSVVSKPTGQPKGRPPLALRDDPERYVATYLAAESHVHPELSERGIAMAVTLAMRGEVVRSRENLSLQDPRGLLFRLSPNEQQRGAEGRAGENRRNASAFQPRADDLARKVRRLAALPIVSDDGRWFVNMKLAWVMALSGDARHAFGAAAFACTAIGETEFFKRVLEPIMDHRLGGLPVPHFSLPDFIPHDDT